MPQYLSPGVYVEELPSARPLEGVGTAVAGFIGVAPAGPTDEAREVTSWEQFARVYGVEQEVARGGVVDHNPYLEGFHLAHAVYGYLQNGGRRAFVVNVLPHSRREATAEPVAPSVPVGPLVVTAVEAGARGLGVEVEHPDGGGPDRFDLVVLRDGEEAERFEGLTLAAEQELVDAVNEGSALVRVSRAAGVSSVTPSSGRYELVAPAATAALPAGTVGADLGPADFLGDPGRRTGMHALTGVDEVTMVCAPDLMTGAGSWDTAVVQSVQRDLVAACADAGDRMMLLDPPPNLDAQQVREWRQSGGFDLPFGVLYWPWLQVTSPSWRPGSPAGPRLLTLPPSGHVAGLWARVDAERGVHKAPANEQVRGVVALERRTSREEQAGLNPLGVNCIRQFPGAGIRVWGARTLAPKESEFRYVNVRRLMNYLQESILEGTQWVVFEPNDHHLWARVRRTVSAFLLGVWRGGALSGATPDEAFFVACDATTNPPDAVARGEVVCHVGVAPVRPAEFVVFRFLQVEGGGSAVTE